MRDSLHLFVDMKDFTVFTDVKGPSKRNRSPVGDDSIGLGHRFTRIAEDGIIKCQGLGELLVGVRCVATGGKVDGLEILETLAARTERLALGRSASGKGFRKPGDNDRFFSFKVSKLIGFSVAALELEIRRRITYFQIGLSGNRSHGNKGRDHKGWIGDVHIEFSLLLRVPNS